MIWRFIKNFLQYLHKTIKVGSKQQTILVTLPQIPFDPMEPLEITARERQLKNWGITEEEASYKI